MAGRRHTKLNWHALTLPFSFTFQRATTQFCFWLIFAFHFYFSVDCLIQLRASAVNFTAKMTTFCSQCALRFTCVLISVIVLFVLLLIILHTFVVHGLISSLQLCCTLWETINWQNDDRKKKKIVPHSLHWISSKNTEQKKRLLLFSTHNSDFTWCIIIIIMTVHWQNICYTECLMCLYVAIWTACCMFFTHEWRKK